MLKRDVQVLFKLTEDEFFKLRRTAKMVGMSNSSFFRVRCLQNTRIVVIDPNVVHDMYNEVNAIGNNINQVVRIAHSKGYVSRDDIILLEEYLEMVYRIVDKKLKGI